MTGNIYSLDKLQEAYSNGHRFNFVLFGAFKPDTQLEQLTKGCLSYEFPSPFTDKEGCKYSNVYQYIMSQKALLFKNEHINRQIMRMTDILKMKELGRLIKNFDEDEWNKNVDEIVYQGNFYKFDQNKELRNLFDFCLRK